MIDWKGFLNGRPRPAKTERRSNRRQRTRLRPGKIVSRDQKFLADCAIIDRSAAGLRLRSFSTVEPEDAAVSIFDENEGLMRSGRVVWTREAEMGIELSGEPKAPDADVLRRLGNPYYAIGD